MSLRARNKQKTRDRILESSEKLFRERGFDETSVDAIAEDAEVGRQTFFNYFATKEAALTEVGLLWLTRGSDQFGGDSQVSPSLPLSQLLHTLLKRQVAAIENDRDFARLVFTRSGVILPHSPDIGKPADEERKSRTLALHKPVEEVFRRAQESGEIRSDIDLRQMVDIWTLTVLMAIRFCLTGFWNASLDFEKRLLTTSDLLIEGFGKR